VRSVGHVVPRGIRGASKRPRAVVGLETHVLLFVKISTGHTHPHRQRTTPSTTTRTHAHDENNTPNEYLPQTLNNARRCRDDASPPISQVMINLYNKSLLYGLRFNAATCGYKNVGYDIHNYYAFGAPYQWPLPISCYTNGIVPLQTFALWLLACGRPVTFGEWSLATSDKLKYPERIRPFMKAVQAFGYSQLRNMQKFEHTARGCGLLASKAGGLQVRIRPLQDILLLRGFRARIKHPFNTPPACIAHTIANLLHDDCAIYDPPLRPPLCMP